MPARSAIVCLLAASVPLSAVGQSTLSGRVLLQQAGDRIPAAGARVVAWSGQQILGSAPVGEDGSFRFTRIPEGAVEFHVSLDRFYVAEVNGAESTKLWRECPASGSCGQADFLLAEGAVVEVFVTDIRGDPVSWTNVLLTERTADEPDSWSVALARNAGRDQTDDLGRARIWGLAPGRYKVWLLPRYDPGFFLPDQPTTEVFVRAGQQTDVNTTVYAAQPLSIIAGMHRPAPGVVAGRIVRSSGRPIAGAGIFVDAEMVAWSALDGTFRFSTPAVESELRVYKSGFRDTSRTVEVKSGETVDAFDILLAPLSAVIGTAVTEEGRPLTGARIRLRRFTWETGVPSLLGAHSTYVDDRGEYRLPGLSPGGYLVGLQPASLPLPQGEAKLLAAPEIFPPAVSLNEMATLSIVRPGTIETVDFEAHEPYNTLISGVIGGAENCEGGCTVSILRAVGELYAPIYTVRTSRGGVYSIRGLPPGAYVLAAYGYNKPREFFGSAGVVIAEGRPDVADFSIAPGARISGTIRLIDPPNSFFTEDGRWKIRPQLLAFDVGIFSGMRSSLPFIVGRPGRPEANEMHVLLDGVPPDRNSLTIGMLFGSYVKSVRVGDQPMHDGLLEIRPGIPPPHITVEIAFDGAAIIGAVSGADLDTAVYAVPAQAIVGYSLRTAEVDADGRFSLDRLAPGRYLLLAAPKNFDGARLHDPLDRRRWGAYIREIAIVSGQTATAALEALPAE